MECGAEVALRLLSLSHTGAKGASIIAWAYKAPPYGDRRWLCTRCFPKVWRRRRPGAGTLCQRACLVFFAHATQETNPTNPCDSLFFCQPHIWLVGCKSDKANSDEDVRPASACESASARVGSFLCTLPCAGGEQLSLFELRTS